MATNPAPVAPVGPSAPNLTVPNLWQQFRTDAYGKEVQTAATYSYTWLADQFGHICIGIVVNYPATVVAGWVIRMIVLAWRFIQRLLFGQEAFTGVTLPEITFGALAGGWVITVIGAALWERSAYLSSVKSATSAFPLGTKLLSDNAIVATVYMGLGATLGFAFHLPASWWTPWVISILVVVAAILLAPPWLRQKITWQKAALPYLFRLANAVATIDPKDAKALQSLIDGGAPPAKPPCQVVIGGPIGSGRTAMAAGIGTEFAFTNHKVRYLSLDTLLEFAASASDDLGPTTITYWPWNEAQVVIIDDVGPLIAAREPRQKANLARFTKLLHNELKSIAGLLAQCHTVWVIGDLRGPPYERGTLGATLGAFAQAIATYCSSQHEALVIELGETAKPRTLKGEPHAATVSNVRWIGPNKNP